MQGIHWRDKITFHRTEDGSVQIRKDGEILALIPPNEWVSIIHHVRKEDQRSIEEASQFHGHGGGVFTDNDLKRLKKAGAVFDLTYDGFLALIARLEAAEAVCRYIDSRHQEYFAITEVEDAIDAWRKATGK